MERNKVDELIGVEMVKDMMIDMKEKKEIEWEKVVKKKIVVNENENVISVMEKLRI